MHKLKSLTNKLILIYLVSLLGVSPSVSAKMYKWVDADGNTHYTQSPPPDGIEGVSIKPPSKVDTNAAQDAIDNQKKRADELQKKREELKEQNAKAEEEKAELDKRCNNARKKVASYSRPRVNLIDEDGNPVRATEEQRQEGLAKAKQYIKENCQ